VLSATGASGAYLLAAFVGKPIVERYWHAKVRVSGAYVVVSDGWSGAGVYFSFIFIIYFLVASYLLTQGGKDPDAAWVGPWIAHNSCGRVFVARFPAHVSAHAPMASHHHQPSTTHITAGLPL
jgi:hypothetical protein